MKSEGISTRLSNFNGQSLCIAAILIFVSAGSNAASFDCKKAKTETEKIICSSPALSKLDQELAKTYRSALLKDFDKTQFQKDQRSWLKWRDFGQCATEITCLEEHYRNRLIEIASRSFCRDVQKKLEVWRAKLTESVSNTKNVKVKRLGEARSFMEAARTGAGSNGTTYLGLDVDRDGKPDKIIGSCGTEECSLDVKLATGDSWHEGLSYPFIVSVFQTRILVIQGGSRNMDPSEEKINHSSIIEIMPTKLQSLCPAI